ncbi:MAG: 2-C-methyl-D-erythritol 2,4-cyclodiphosphate synthase [Candidatus Omnitrophica bacterium]|nr:2-C-methyl-D-erythritol 2,4-cyclodiphosphate synthase [Candidatus Omnitrophota bacterium]
MIYRVGIGYDIHRLTSGRKLFLGGVEIPYINGLLGHSDADVLLHAVSDAILGAIGEGDIGEHFPDTDPQYHNASSSELLKVVMDLAGKKGFKVGNIDTVVIAEEPNITPFKKQMQQSIAQILKIPQECVNIKAKTNERLGAIGKKEAIAGYAVVMLIGEE